jgi:hypothetical protein
MTRRPSTALSEITMTNKNLLAKGFQVFGSNNTVRQMHGFLGTEHIAKI